jgi:hypothetical protein
MTLRIAELTRRGDHHSAMTFDGGMKMLRTRSLKVTKSLFAAATAIGATCILPVAAPAQADGCDNFYAFPDPGAPSKFNVELVDPIDRAHQDHIFLRTTDNKVQTVGWSSGSSGVSHTPRNEIGPARIGTARGDGLYGRTIDFKVFWPNGGISEIKGRVNDDRSASGTVVSTATGTSSDGPWSGNWHSAFADFRCAKGHKLGQRPIGGDGQTAAVASDVQTAAVASDVDVYNAKNEPDGTGQVVGMLRAGNSVKLAGSCAPDSWCEVSGDSVPSGHGWVWGHLELP